PSVPTVNYTGPTNFPADHLAFHCSDYSGPAAFAAMKWRVGEISDPKTPAFRSRRREEADAFEITPVWESPELTAFTPDLALPSSAVKPNHLYRLRARIKDATGRWSHWSAPVEFRARPAAG